MSTFLESTQQFVEAWNHHGVRTECGQTPHQNLIFTAGSLRLRHSGLSALDTVAESYGVDSDLGVADDPEANEDPEGVEVPATELDISPEQTTELQSTVNPLGESDNFGIDIFMQTLEVLRSFFS